MSDGWLLLSVDTEVGANNRGWVQLHMPTGGVVTKGKQKFEVTAEDIAAFAESIKANPGRVPIDYDHSFDKTGSSRAAGWVDASTVEVRDGGELWAMADWTPAAAQSIRDGEYRYISPEFTFKASKNGVLRGAARFVAATLTNRPFLNQMAAVRLDEDAKTPTEGDTMKDLAKTLGLAEDADEKTILAAVATRDEAAKALQLKLDEQTAALATATEELTALRTTASEGDKKVAKLELEVAGMLKANHETRLKAVLDQGIKDTKMDPAEREAMTALAETAGIPAIEALLLARNERPLNGGKGSSGDGPPAGDRKGTKIDGVEVPVDAASAELAERVDAHILSLKLDHPATVEEYLAAVDAVRATTA